MKTLKTSFCTTCMNRLHHLKETLPKNIEDNKDFKNLEFVLLDYNSTDGLEEFVKENWQEHIKKGRLAYYKTTIPHYYNASHARNLAFKLAKGDIICNIDADNFTGIGFAKYVATEFNNPTIFLAVLKPDGPTIKKDAIGRICVKKEDFLAIRGYDEQMIHYGFEDYDLINRLEMRGVQRQLITDDGFLQTISHNNKERLTNGFKHQHLYQVLICYLSPSTSELVFLYKDNKYKRGTMVNTLTYNATNTNKINNKYDYAIIEDLWEDGIWKHSKKNITLNEHKILEFKEQSNCYSGTDKNYHVLKSGLLIEEAHFFYNQVANRIILEKNLKLKKIEVNEHGFGEAAVNKHFKNVFSD